LTFSPLSLDVKSLDGEGSQKGGVPLQSRRSLILF